MKLTKVDHNPFAKVSKASVSYSHGMKSSHCGICEFYDNRACSKVAGAIDPAYWCRLFRKQHRAVGGMIRRDDGGLIPQRTAPFPEAPEGYEYYQAPEGVGATDVPGVGMVNTSSNDQIVKVGSGLARGMADWVTTPGETMKGVAPIEPQTPGQWSEEDQYRQNLAQAEQAQKQTDFGVQTALSTMGATPFGITPGEATLAAGVARRPSGRPPSEIYWHGSASGDLRGGKSGLHLGTQDAAKQALEARIGVPADGQGWTGDKKYGETLLAGQDTLKELDPNGYNVTGYNVDAPKEDYYPTKQLKYPDGTPMPMDVQPAVRPYRITGNMTNTPDTPFDDFKANGYMRGQLKRGSAKNGYFYKNVAEDSGSISAVVPNGGHIEPVDSGTTLGSGTTDKRVGAAISAFGAEQHAKPFYSAVERAIQDIPQEKASGPQWAATLRNRPGVKPEEMEWLGLNDWLSQQRGPVTKDQVADYVRNNQVQLQEVVKGEHPINKESKYAIPEVRRIINQAGETPGDLELTLANDGDAYRALMRRFPELEGNEDWAQIVANDVYGGGTKTGTKFGQYTLPGGPLSRDTEILTNAGWRRMDEIAVGDTVMTRRDEDGELEWQAVECVPKVHAKELYHFKNQSIDMMVTAEHRMVVKRRRRSSRGIFRTTASELWSMSECVVPLTGKWLATGNSKIFGLDACDVAEFVGWFISEGSSSVSRKGNKSTISIAQSKEANAAKCARLEALFDRLGFSWKYYGVSCGSYGIGIRKMNKELKELLHAQPLSGGKYIPKLFFTQWPKVIDALLTGLILGDGTTIKATKIRLARTFYFTKSKRLAGDVQALVLLTGRRASVRQRPSGLYVVSINTKEWAGIDDAKHAIVPYNDYAFCVTVKNHAIYVRRNGVAAFTGNSDYREMLMTMPMKTEPAQVSYARLFPEVVKNAHTLQDIADARKFNPSFRETMRLFNDQEALDAVTHARENAQPAEDYKSPHFDEPNVLAHVRFNDRVIDGKKTLFVEEVQSDWHQAGKRKGYTGDKQIGKLTEDELNEYDLLANMPERNWSLEQRQRFQELDTRANAYEGQKAGVPDAPFKTTWPELAMKRILKYAADNGYQKVAWTPGDVQAARYDLSKHVDVVHYNPEHQMLAYKSKGSDNWNEVEDVSKEKLSNYIGKDAAEKILNTEPDHGVHILKGLDLKVGGEGMKGFYDQILPATVNKLVKKYGAKVGRSELKSGHDMWTVEKTEEGYGVNNPENQFEYEAVLPTRAQAERYIRQMRKGEPPPSTTVHAVDITQQMQKAITERGFPQFSKGGSVKSRLVPVAHDPFKAHTVARRIAYGNQRT